MLAFPVFGTLLYLMGIGDHGRIISNGEPAGERITDLSAAGSEGAFPSGKEIDL